MITQAFTARVAHFCRTCQPDPQEGEPPAIGRGHRHLRHTSLAGDASYIGPVPSKERECLACAAKRNEMIPIGAGACAAPCHGTNPCALLAGHVGDRHSCRDCRAEWVPPQRSGDGLRWARTPYTSELIIETLGARSTTDPATGCKIWHGARDDKGYGVITVGPKMRRFVHQASWEAFCVPIPAGFEPDHLCHTKDLCGLDSDCPHRPCWNPDHLELVTHRENIRRGESPSGVNARKTHCVRGHELAGDNIRLYGNRRYCKPCRAIWSKNRRSTVGEAA